MKPAIVAYAFDADRCGFFERFRTALNGQGIELVVVSNRPSLLLDYPLTRCLSRPMRTHKECDDLIRNSLEFRVGNRNLRAARRLVCALEDCLAVLEEEYALKAVFIWNGSALPERIMSRFARQRNIDTVYFENANVPGRMIVDSEGVNAQCSIARDPSLLDNYPSPLSISQFEEWSRNYIESQRRSHNVHQAKGVNQINWSFIFDVVVQCLKGIPKYEMYPLLIKIFRKLDALLYRPRNRYLAYFPERFVFLPLQVESDTQLIFNSDIGNEDAIRLVSNKLEPGQKLVVKQHPAEPDKRAQRLFSKIIKEVGGIETSNNTFDLMLAAEKVYTINSTAGLQAKLMGKPVECLGSAVFAHMDDEDLNCYVHGFLASIELFSLDPVVMIGDLNALSKASSFFRSLKN